MKGVGWGKDEQYKHILRQSDKWEEKEQKIDNMQCMLIAAACAAMH